MSLVTAWLQRNPLASLERAWWRVLARCYGTTVVQAGTLQLRTLDTRSRLERIEHAVEPVTREALQRISAARGGFGELVTSHLRIVAIMPGPPEGRVHAGIGAYVTSFTGAERTNAHHWAAQLIWAATIVRLTHNAVHARRAWREPGIRQAAWEAQVRFLRSFEGGDVWVSSMAVAWDPSANPASTGDGTAAV